MLTHEQKAAWLRRLRDPATPTPSMGFSGKCALYYALPAEGYKDMTHHWQAVYELVGMSVFDEVAKISDSTVLSEDKDKALIYAAHYIEANVPSKP